MLTGAEVGAVYVNSLCPKFLSNTIEKVEKILDRYCGDAASVSEAKVFFAT